jgi:adenosine deaminase CECR1
MMFGSTVALLLASITSSSTALLTSDETFEMYLNQRNSFLQVEESLSINSVWKLTPEEEHVDSMLKALKSIDQQLDPIPTQFAFSTMHSTIDNSKLFHLVKQFPKGGLLHSHDTSSQDMYFYVEQSYRSDCLYNVGDDPDMYGSITYQPGPDYVPISEVRNAWPGGVEKFDNELYLNLTLLPYLDQPDTTGDYLWEKFQPIFSRVGNAYQYLPVFQQYFREMFPKLWDDGITQWQMRTSLIGAYDGNKTYSQAETLQFILNELDAWKAEDPEKRNVFSFSIVIQGIRDAPVEEVTAALTSAYALRAQFPDVIVGFDLVGHEDPGKTLLYWAPILMATELALHNDPAYASSPNMPFLFHAGESNRYRVQENLVDAVLLNTSRIGHGFGIQEFPALWPLLTEKNIIIESCPISNQLLGLIVDQRNHPIGQMLHHAAHSVTHKDSKMYDELVKVDQRLQTLLFDKMNFIPSLSVSLSNDDPGFWGIDAIMSYDWYIAVLAWDLSLGAIKQLAMDSIVYSGVGLDKRVELLLDWNAKWNVWIDSLQ